MREYALVCRSYLFYDIPSGIYNQITGDKMTSSQIVFNSKKAAIKYYVDAVRLGRTVSLPFKRPDNGRFQITELHKSQVS